MKTGTPKQYLEIAGKPLYKYCLETFEKSALITDIVLVVPEEDVARFREELRIEFDEFEEAWRAERCASEGRARKGQAEQDPRSRPGRERAVQFCE